MGSTLMGGAKHSGNVQLQTQGQQDLLESIIGQAGPGAMQAYQQMLQPGGYDDLFQQSVVDPAMLAYEQQALPAIQQRFVDAGAGSSSALNQALGQSAADLSTMIGQQAGQFYQNQQSNQLSTLQLLNQLIGQQTFEPMVAQQSGLAGPMIGAAGTLGGAYLGGPWGAAAGGAAGQYLGGQATGGYGSSGR